MADHVTGRIPQDETEIIVGVHAAGRDKAGMKTHVDGPARIDWECLRNVKSIEGHIVLDLVRSFHPRDVLDWRTVRTLTSLEE
jgi:hypothetical protein